jgi:hypothetical protein
MLAAGQPAQVPQEDQEHLPPSAQRFAQGDGLSIGRRQFKVRRSIAWS